MTDFHANNQVLLTLIKEWEPKLKVLSEEVIAMRRNNQNRTIKQILGHMIDSASNNTHRIIHLQYQPDPLIFPDYANLGNNDRWIAVQNYQDENWKDLIQLWKYSNYHITHVINNVIPMKLKNHWISALGQHISLEEMILGYLSHFKLHLKEIEALINES
jgi:hypothetical protein